jgi:hypothetical protein
MPGTQKKGRSNAYSRLLYKFFAGGDKPPPLPKALTLMS